MTPAPTSIDAFTPIPDQGVILADKHGSNNLDNTILVISLLFLIIIHSAQNSNSYPDEPS